MDDLDKSLTVNGETIVEIMKNIRTMKFQIPANSFHIDDETVYLMEGQWFSCTPEEIEAAKKNKGGFIKTAQGIDLYLKREVFFSTE